MEFVEKHPTWSWNWYEMSLNHTIEFVKEHLDFSWNWSQFSWNKNFIHFTILKKVLKNHSMKK